MYMFINHFQFFQLEYYFIFFVNLKINFFYFQLDDYFIFLVNLIISLYFTLFDELIYLISK